VFEFLTITCDFVVFSLLYAWVTAEFAAQSFVDLLQLTNR